MNISLILSVIAIVLSLVSIFALVWIFLLFKNLVKLTKDKEFVNNTKEIKELRKELEDFRNISKSDIQKVGLIKYNPFSESGGDHSFSLSLFDGNKNGIIITSLHARERTRLYIKDVTSGKAKIELSTEEQKSLQLALK